MNCCGCDKEISEKQAEKSRSVTGLVYCSDCE